MNHRENSKIGPKVSVIIPTYNSAEYISDAIESVLTQTYENHEIIVVDDGSTDNTKEVVSKYGPKIRYIYQKNGGPSRARNTGIMNSTGEYIAFLDSDDIWLAEKLELQVRYFQQHPNVGMVFTEGCIFKEGRNIQGRIGKREKLMSGDIVRNILMKSGIATPTVMVRRSVLERVGLFDETLTTAEDDNMWLRIASVTNLGLIDEVLVKHRVDDGLGRQRLSEDPERIIQGALRNLELIETKYKGVEKKLSKKIINKKYSMIYFDYGRFLLDKGDYRKAKRMFLKSIGYGGFNIKSYLYLASAFLPHNIILMIKRVNRKVRGLEIREN